MSDNTTDNVPDSTPQATVETLQREVEALRAKNSELLGKYKAVQAARDEAQAALEAAQATASDMQGQVRALRLDAPVAALLDDIALDAELFQGLFNRHYRFELDDAGAIVILDAEGQPAMVTEPDKVTHLTGSRGKPQEEQRTSGQSRPAAFTANDVRRLAETCPDADKLARVLVASRADGGGALGSKGLQPSPSPVPKPDKPKLQPFGLR